MTCKCFHSRNLVLHFVLAGISRRLVLYYRSCAHLSTAFPKKNHKKSRTTIEPHGSMVNAGSRHPFYMI